VIISGYCSVHSSDSWNSVSIYFVNGLRENYHTNFADQCEKDYPGDPACDRLREIGDAFLAAVVC